MSLPLTLTNYQLQGIKKLIGLKENFSYDNLSWLNANHHSSVQQYNNIIDTFINTFCSYELADNNYISIHLEANQYNRNKELFVNSTIEKLLKHITYIIWTDKLVDGYLPARVKDQTIYNILERLSQLEPLILTTAA